jgi:hypothetical protein
MCTSKKKNGEKKEETTMTMTTTPVINEHALIEWRLNSLVPSDDTLGVHYKYEEERETERENVKETCQMSSQELICRGS